MQQEQTTIRSNEWIGVGLSPTSAGANDETPAQRVGRAHSKEMKGSRSRVWQTGGR